MLTFRKLLFVAALAAATPALAQSEPTHDNAAVKDVHTVNSGGARRGANSFTQGEARQHILNSGFTHVSALRKDRRGVWRGTARKDGHTVQVGLDFTGNVSTGE